MDESPDRPERSARRFGAIFAILAAAVAVLPFLPALTAEFVNLDDDKFFVENPAFRGLDLQHLRWMFTTTRMGHYAPLTWVSAAVDFTIAGLDPRQFHRTNLLLHAIASALFFLLAVRVLRLANPIRARAHPRLLRIAALAAALLFAVHPLRVETVAWITERRGLLGAVFLLAAMLAWLRACEPNRAQLASRGWYAVSIAALALSLLSKGLGMTFVALVIVLDFWPLRRLPARARDLWKPEYRAVWLQKIPLLALGAASAVVSAWAAASAPDTVRSLAQWGPLARVAQSGYGLLFYVGKTLWPSGLAPVYELPAAFHPVEPRFLAGMIAAVLFLPLLFVLCRRAPWLAVALATYALALAPVLGFLQAGPQLVADRYSYVACMPWALLAGGALLLLWSRSAVLRIASTTGLIAIVVVLGLRSRWQTEAWHDSRALWTRALEAGAPSSTAYNNLGILDGRAGNHASAISCFQSSLAIQPEQGQAWFNLGVTYVFEQRYEEAAEAFQKARRWMKPAWSPLINLGDLYLNHLNRIDDSVSAYREAVADVESRGPEFFSPFPYLGFGLALMRKGEPEAAQPFLRNAARFPETRAAALRALAR
jgi:tetratricopeptide (TPR) repeat protein